MKIAQIARLAGGVPPRLNGGTERVISYLTEELVRLGHDVTLFSSADPAMRERAREFDVLHFHLDGAPLPSSTVAGRRALATVHERLDLPAANALYREFSAMPLVSVSASQRAALPAANWIATVHPGLPAEVCPLNPSPPRGNGRYLAFVGHAASEDGVERATDIARACGMDLRIARLGELEESRKPALLGNATALVVPVEGAEPFGFAMIEAMSCGTPVVAWREGAAAEIVDEDATGFLAGSLAEAVQGVQRAARLDRTLVRERFEQRFSAARMARDYLAVYRTLGRQRARRPAGAPAA